jgi:hypothetical protein
MSSRLGKSVHWVYCGIEEKTEARNRATETRFWQSSQLALQKCRPLGVPPRRRLYMKSLQELPEILGLRGMGYRRDSGLEMRRRGAD